LGAGLKIAGAWSFTRGGRIVILFFVASVVALAGAAAIFSYSGFCFEKRRFLQDQEYIDAVIEEIIRRPNYTRIISKPESVHLKPSRVIPYRDKDAFRNANPNCCTMVQAVGDKGPETTVWDRLYGRAARLVSVKYRVNFVDDDQTTGNETTTIIYAVTNCGRAWNARN
jgi:hypothetical protein